MSNLTWSTKRKIGFRFLFILLALFTSPWLWFDQIPGVSFVTQFYYSFDRIWVSFLNKHFLHVKEVLNMDGGGSGDTSYAWAQMYSYLMLAVVGCIIWSALDRKRNDYVTLDFWLRNTVRYYVSMVSFTYGIIKLFALQMPFPNLSQLATPLGDYLPMRFSWMFVGYSAPYQIFSGVAETMVAILLLNRRTITIGALMGVGVFANVVMLNLSYDIPVKLYSSQLLFCCLFLVLNDWKRIAGFFLLNKPVESDHSYNFTLNKKWLRIGRAVMKVAFIILFALMPFYDSWSRYKEEYAVTDVKPIRSGVYDVKYFVRNNDTIPLLVNDSLIWKDMIFEEDGFGSVNSSDTLFRQRYRRGYFNYSSDTVQNTISFRKRYADTIPVFVMKYQLPDDKTVKLSGKIRNDSVYIELLKCKRHFQLAERQIPLGVGSKSLVNLIPRYDKI